MCIPIRWSQPSAALRGDAAAHESDTRDLSATGFSFRHAVAVPTGTHITVDFHPEFAEPVLGIDGMVACSTAGVVEDGGTSLVGVRVAVAPGASLQRLLLAAYEQAADHASVCCSVRHCGDLRKACPAFAANRNCWQVERVPCCDWQRGGARPDCAECPISVLAFMSP